MSFTESPEIQYDQPGGVYPPLNRRVLLFLAAVILIAWRQPAILTEPRFWAEEGTYFFSYAYSHGWFDTISHIVPLFGFYSLAHNLAGLAATFFPLESAPFATIYLGFILYLLPCSVVIFGNSPYWETLNKKIVVCLGILLFPFGRMWLNTTYTHYILALTVFLVLLEPVEPGQRVKKVIFRAMILLGGLSGAVSCFFTPAYMLKAFRSRTKEHIIQASLMAATSFLQIAAFIYTVYKLNPAAQTRFNAFGLGKLLSISFFQFAVPFAGRPFFELETVKNINDTIFYRLFPILYPRIGEAVILFKEPVTLILILMVLAYLLFVVFSQITDKNHQLLSVSFLFLFAISSAGSVHMAGGPRYTYVPCVIMLIMFMTEFFRTSSKVRKSAAAVVIMLMLAINAYAYRKGTEICWPKWDEECSKWRAQNDYALKIWPYNESEHWEMKLERRQ